MQLVGTTFGDLKGRTIESIEFGHPLKSEVSWNNRAKRNRYGVLTIKTDKGTFVFSCSLLESEISAWKEVEDDGQ